MAETVIKKLHSIEYRKKDHLSGRWSRWFVLPHVYFSFVAAKRERDVLRGDGRDCSREDHRGRSVVRDPTTPRLRAQLKWVTHDRGATSSPAGSTSFALRLRAIVREP